MSPIKPSHLLIAMAAVFALAGCGDKNSNVVFSPESKHPAGWAANHRDAAVANLDSCTECHGENYDGGIARVSCMSPTAISGMTCHATSAADNPVGCVSCHGGLTSGPFGTTKPNTKAAHAKHVALLGSGSCNVCHQNAGSGTANHARAAASGFRPATVALSVYSTTGTVLGYDSAKTTCTNVRCHGGKETPLWADTTSLIVVNNNVLCEKCHDYGTAQFNSYNSGNFSDVTPAINLHFSHVNRTTGAAKCTDCHNIGKLTDYQLHFSGIATKSMPSKGKTVGNVGADFPSKIKTYNTTSGTCSFNPASGCHVADRSWGL